MVGLFFRFYPWISIHALRGEDDKKPFILSPNLPSISIHALRGEDDSENIITPPLLTISIHALRGEDDRTD